MADAAGDQRQTGDVKQQQQPLQPLLPAKVFENHRVHGIWRPRDIWATLAFVAVLAALQLLVAQPELVFGEGMAAEYIGNVTFDYNETLPVYNWRAVVGIKSITTLDEQAKPESSFWLPLVGGKTDVVVSATKEYTAASFADGDLAWLRTIARELSQRQLVAAIAAVVPLVWLVLIAIPIKCIPFIIPTTATVALVSALQNSSVGPSVCVLFVTLSPLLVYMVLVILHPENVAVFNFVVKNKFAVVVVSVLEALAFVVLAQAGLPSPANLYASPFGIVVVSARTVQLVLGAIWMHIFFLEVVTPRLLVVSCILKPTSLAKTAELYLSAVVSSFVATLGTPVYSLLAWLLQFVLIFAFAAWAAFGIFLVGGASTLVDKPSFELAVKSRLPAPLLAVTGTEHIFSFFIWLGVLLLTAIFRWTYAPISRAWNYASTMFLSVPISAFVGWSVADTVATARKTKLEKQKSTWMFVIFLLALFPLGTAVSVGVLYLILVLPTGTLFADMPLSPVQLGLVTFFNLILACSANSLGRMLRIVDLSVGLATETVIKTQFAATKTATAGKPANLKIQTNLATESAASPPASPKLAPISSF